MQLWAALLQEAARINSSLTDLTTSVLLSRSQLPLPDRRVCASELRRLCHQGCTKWSCLMMSSQCHWEESRAPPSVCDGTCYTFVFMQHFVQ